MLMIDQLLGQLAILYILWNSKADKIIKLKYIVKFATNAWATFKAWSKCSLIAWSSAIPMHRQHYQAQTHCQMRMHCQCGQLSEILAANPPIISLSSQSTGWAGLPEVKFNKHAFQLPVVIQPTHRLAGETNDGWIDLNKIIQLTVNFENC